jgi:hypothetical protein
VSATWDEVLEAEAPQADIGAMARAWGVPPFSVLDTQGGVWPERRRAWLAMGIRSELGRAEVLGGLNSFTPAKYGAPRSSIGKVTDEGKLQDGGMSVFDPVLCELVYRWWCPAGGSVLDPFAGGSVRGIVAAMLGHAYTGIELSGDQVAANREQAQAIVPADKPQPRWFVGDSRQLVDELPAGELYDLVFTCPPYWDLERYSDHPADLSNLASYGEFLEAYQDVVAACCRRLRPERFAVWVVSDVRDAQGFYVGLRRDTELAFERASLRLYNDAALVDGLDAQEAQDVVRKWDEAKLLNSAGTLPLRAGRYMRHTRKLGRIHQDVLVFTRTKLSTLDWDHARSAPPSPQLTWDLPREAHVLELAVAMTAGTHVTATLDTVPCVLPMPAPPPTLEPDAGRWSYRLTAEERQAVLEEAQAGQAYSTGAGHRTKAGQLVAKALEDTQLGVAGEVALAQLLGLQRGGLVTSGPWERRQDLLGGVEVRTRSRPDYELLVRPDELEDTLYVLVTVHERVVTARGWLYGYDARDPGWLQEHGGRDPAYFVPTAQLRPMDALPRCLLCQLPAGHYHPVDEAYQLQVQRERGPEQQGLDL